MAPLFFAVAAASSNASGPSASALALLPGASGWQSARCCPYPQELLLELEHRAEVHEIEISARGDFTPKAVDVHISSGGDFFGTLQDCAFEHAGTVHFDGEATPRRTSALRRSRLKLFALCSGHVRLEVHEPLMGGPGNPYCQVGLVAVEIYGHEGGAAAARPRSRQGGAGAGPAAGGPGREVVQVLTELGIPLSIVPADEDAHHFAEVDSSTRQLLMELQRRRPQLLQASKFGEAQQLSEHMQHLGALGAELRQLQEQRDRYVGAGELRDAQRLTGSIRDLEERRLAIAALHETDFWLEHMALPPSDDGAAQGAAGQAPASRA